VDALIGVVLAVTTIPEWAIIAGVDAALLSFRVYWFDFEFRVPDGFIGSIDLFFRLY
jgi:hypothetical protein